MINLKTALFLVGIPAGVGVLGAAAWKLIPPNAYGAATLVLLIAVLLELYSKWLASVRGR